MNKEWCKEHITTMNNWFVTKSGKRIEIQDDWNFCPICGTPRPEPKKGLADKIRDTFYYRPNTLQNVSAEDVCITAYEHFSEIVDEWADEIHQSGVSLRDELKKRFRESL